MLQYPTDGSVGASGEASLAAGASDEYTFPSDIEKAFIAIDPDAAIKLRIRWNGPASNVLWDATINNGQIESPKDLRIKSVGLYNIGPETLTLNSNISVRGYK